MKILLIEDMAGFAIPIRQELQAQGHQVIWIVGATKISANAITGITARAEASGMEPDEWHGELERLCEIPFQGLALALVDGGLIGPVSKGSDFVSALTGHGVNCIAISGGGAGNPPLLEVGACAGVPKEYVVLALRNHVLCPKNLLKPGHTDSAALDQFTTDTRTQWLQERKEGRRIKLGIPVLDGCP